MAIYHCSISNVSRAKGSSSCANLAYISGEKIHDERTGNTYAYSRQERVLTVGTILPPFAPAEYANAETLFNAIEKHETADNARTAKKIQVALPKELELAEQKNIIEDYIKHNLTKEGYCATYAIHDGGKKGNFHAHILVANRPINTKGEWSIKSRKAYALDENGKKIPVLDEATGKQKERIRKGKGVEKVWKRVNIEQNPLDTRDFLFHLRKEWATEVNKHLEPSQYIDHRSNAERGLEDAPTIHEGYAARAIESRGGTAERCEINREIMQDNIERRQVRQELATRKTELEKQEEREEIDRVRTGIARRKRAIIPTIGAGTGRTIDIESQGAVRVGTGVNHPRPAIRDYVSETEQYKFDATEREIARISKEREEAARRELKAKEILRQERAGLEIQGRGDSRTQETERGLSR